MWTTPLIAALALAAQTPEPAAPPPAPAPASTPAPQPYGDPNYPQQPPPNYQQPPPGQPPPPGYQPYGYPPPGYQPYGYPPQSYGPPPPPPPRIRGKGMMIAGFSIFAGTWLSAIVLGAGFIDNNTPSGYMYGRRLMVPVLGPFLAAGIPDDGASTNMAYVFLGLAQTAGLALGITGAVLFSKSRKAARTLTSQGLHLGRGVHMSSSPRWGGGTLNLKLQF